MYAIVKTGGKQYTVKPGDVFDVEKIEGEAGDSIDLPVLFLNDGSQIVTDADVLASTTVTAQILEQHKGDKKIIFKFKKRKGYKRTRGHRQLLTRIAITNVAGETAEAPSLKKEETPVEEPAVEEVVEEAVVEETAVEETAEQAEAADVDLESMTVAQLKDLAAEKDIHVPSGARKADIIELIQNA